MAYEGPWAVGLDMHPETGQVPAHYITSYRLTCSSGWSARVQLGEPTWPYFPHPQPNLHSRHAPPLQNKARHGTINQSRYIGQPYGACYRWQIVMLCSVHRLFARLPLERPGPPGALLIGPSQPPRRTGRLRVRVERSLLLLLFRLAVRRLGLSDGVEH